MYPEASVVGTLKVYSNEKQNPCLQPSSAASVAVGSVFDPSVLHMVLRYSEADFDSPTKDMSVMLLALVGTVLFP